MAFLDNISKAAQSTVKKSGDMVEITRLNFNIRSETEAVTKICTQIGKTVYDKFAAGGGVIPECRENCESINQHEQAIKVYRLKILDLRNMKACSNCGAEMEIAATFCAKCGTKQEGQPDMAADVYIDCPSCGAKVLQDTRFCNTCGARIAAVAAEVPAVRAPVETPTPVEAPAPTPVSESVPAPIPAPELTLETAPAEAPAAKEYSDDFLQNYPKYKSGEINAADFAKILGMSKTALGKKVKEYEGIA